MPGSTKFKMQLTKNNAWTREGTSIDLLAGQKRHFRSNKSLNSVMSDLTNTDGDPIGVPLWWASRLAWYRFSKNQMVGKDQVDSRFKCKWSDDFNASDCPELIRTIERQELNNARAPYGIMMAQVNKELQGAKNVTFNNGFVIKAPTKSPPDNWDSLEPGYGRNGNLHNRVPKNWNYGNWILWDGYRGQSDFSVGSLRPVTRPFNVKNPLVGNPPRPKYACKNTNKFWEKNCPDLLRNSRKTFTLPPSYVDYADYVSHRKNRNDASRALANAKQKANAARKKTFAGRIGAYFSW